MTELIMHAPSTGWVRQINTRWHERALWIYMAVVVLHWLEHILQAHQIWILEMPRPEALGLLGYLFPILASSEILHFGFALVLFAGLLLLLPGFRGEARGWWLASLAIQSWHLFEHSLLQFQAAMGVNFFGGLVPTSIGQIWVPRPELHLVYNALVFIPMVVGMWLHTRPNQTAASLCTCAVKQVAQSAG